jgi:uncharacterized protein (DUF1810 family)
MLIEPLTPNPNGDHDLFDLQRFLKSQEGIYARALSELKRGQKRSHWMWFIFPQIEGLGQSATTRFYSIKSLEEARAYLGHPVLGARLLECANALLEVEGRSASEIFGYPDDMKLQSCMTLFASLTDAPDVFGQVLKKYYLGERDEKTIAIMRTMK